MGPHAQRCSSIAVDHAGQRPDNPDSERKPMIRRSDARHRSRRPLCRRPNAKIAVYLRAEQRRRQRVSIDAIHAADANDKQADSRASFSISAGRGPTIVEGTKKQGESRLPRRLAARRRNSAITVWRRVRRDHGTADMDAAQLRTAKVPT